jgi:hypothetical protein
MSVKGILTAAADPTFGSGGRAPVGFPGSPVSAPNLTVQPDGKILWVGATANTAGGATWRFESLPPGSPAAASRRVPWRSWWYLLGTEDKAIPPALQHFMAERANATIVEVPASHVSFVSQPEAAIQLILRAVEAESHAESDSA